MVSWSRAITCTFTNSKCTNISSEDLCIHDSSIVDGEGRYLHSLVQPPLILGHPLLLEADESTSAISIDSFLG